MFVGTQSLEHFQAVHLRQFQIQQDQRRLLGQIPPLVGAASKQEIQRLDPVARDVDLVGNVVFLECPQCKHLVVRIILDEQNG